MSTGRICPLAGFWLTHPYVDVYLVMDSFPFPAPCSFFFLLTLTNQIPFLFLFLFLLLIKEGKPPYTFFEGSHTDSPALNYFSGIVFYKKSNLIYIWLIQWDLNNGLVGYMCHGFCLIFY